MTNKDVIIEDTNIVPTEIIDNPQMLDMSKLEKDGKNLLIKVEKLEIVTAEDLTKASEYLSESNKIIKSMSDLRLSITRVIDGRKNDIMTKEKERVAPANDSKTIVQKKILEYNQKLQEIQRKKDEELKAREDALKKAQEEAEAKAKEEADKKAREDAERIANLDNPEDIAQIQNEAMLRDFKAQKEKEEADKKAKEEADNLALEKEAQKLNATATKVKGLIKTLKIEVTDPDLVPREFCMPDESKIRDTVKKLKLVNWSIPWVRIREETSVR